MARFTPAEVIAAIDAESSLAVDSRFGQLQSERADALAWYRGEPNGLIVEEGRSEFVDKTILDTIEWIMPSLIRIYLGGDEIGKFEPTGPEDEEAAKTETEVCNWYLNTKSDIFSHVSATLRDALLLKSGYMIGQWTARSDTMVEHYEGKTEDEFGMLLADPDIEVLEHTAYPDPSAPPPAVSAGGQLGAPFPPGAGGLPQLHDVKVERKYADEFVAVESIPCEEIRVSPRHRWTSLLDADFCQWRRKVTIGQLRAEGFKNIKADEPQYEEFTQEAVTRARFNETSSVDDESPDPTRRVVMFNDTYIRMDQNETGTQQLWRVCHIEGSKEPILMEEADIVPFAAFSPIIYPHSHVGSSVYDLVVDLAQLKTVMTREYIDAMRLATRPRMGVDASKVGPLTIDDLLSVRPGGIIRTQGPPGEVLMPIVMPDTSSASLSGIEYADSIAERRTGVTRYSAGLDANTLNKTATGVQAIQSAANQRIELIARTLASGFKDLFLIVHALACKHATRPLQLKLNNQWIAVNPREWTRRTDFSISVGLGTGTPETQLQKLMMLTPLMQQSMQMGLSGVTEAYNFGTEIWKAAGYKTPDKFLKPPKMAPKMGPNGQPVMGPDGKPVMEAQMPPPQADPIVQAEQVKAQAGMQQKTMELQASGQIAQAKAAAEAQAQATRAQADMTIQQHKVQSDAELELARTRMQLQLEELKHSREQETQIQIANIRAAAQVEVARISKLIDDGSAVLGAELAASGGQAGAALLDKIDQLVQQMNAPKKLVRDPQTGRVAGVVTVQPPPQPQGNGGGTVQ